MDADLRAALERHHPFPGTPERECMECNLVWPCDAARALAALDAAEVDKAAAHARAEEREAEIDSLVKSRNRIMEVYDRLLEDENSARSQVAALVEALLGEFGHVCDWRVNEGGDRCKAEAVSVRNRHGTLVPVCAEHSDLSTAATQSQLNTLRASNMVLRSTRDTLTSQVAALVEALREAEQHTSVYGKFVWPDLSNLSAAATQRDAELRRAAVEAALSVERIAEALRQVSRDQYMETTYGTVWRDLDNATRAAALRAALEPSDGR